MKLIICFIILGFGFGVNGYHEYEKGGREVGVYEVKRGNFSIKFTNWGATLISLVVPDRYGNLADIALGYGSVKEYMNDTTYFGSIVGRVANRIGGAQFTIDGIHYKLKPNEKKNMLHGGKVGFSDVVWKVTKHESDRITFFYHSFDGEEGALNVSVSYAIVAPYVLSIKMRAKSINKATPVNLAQHTYWNLGGHNSGDVLSDEIQIFGSHFTPTDEYLIPTGKIVSVKGTPYDFLKPHIIGSRINQLLLHNGYDVNYVLDAGKSAARVYNKKSGRVMELSTNEPGLQFYTANYVQNVTGKGGYVYQPHAALCLESQGFPDSVNHLISLHRLLGLERLTSITWCLHFQPSKKLSHIFNLGLFNSVPLSYEKMHQE